MLCSCKKENHKRWTEINIDAKNYLTGEPIKDVSCGVFYFDGKTNVVLDAGLTENGSYSFGFKWKKNKIHWAEASIPIDKYYTVTFANSLVVEMGEINNYQFELVPKGNLRLNVKNINCFDEYDEILIHHINCLDVPGNDVISNPNIDTHFGCYVDIFTTPTLEPVGRYEYYYHIKRNGITNYYTDTVVVKQGEVTEIKIHY